MNGQGIPYGCNSSYSFLPILSKLHLCFGHGLKICMWFGYNPHIIFVTFSKVELSFFSDNFYNKVNGQKIPCGGNSSYSFIPILLKLHWCFGHGLKICMWLGYNPQINFIIIKPQLNVYHFSSIYRLQCYQYHQCLYIYSASMKSYQYRNFDISKNILYSSLATVTFMFLVNDTLVWRDKTVTRALKLWCT